MENQFTYKEFIENILATRGRHGCGNEYHETHHILPKCLDGTNDEENLIDLFASEHFIAHKLLAQENPDDEKLVYAWWCMCSLSKSSQEDIVTEKEYEKARLEFKKRISELQSGENNSFFGKHHTEKTKKRISEVHSGINNHNYGKHLSEDTKKKIGNKNRGKRHSKEAIEKIRKSISGECNGMYGRHHTNESKIKMSENKKGKYSGENSHMFGKHLSDDTKEKISQSNSKKVFCVELNQYFTSISEASHMLGIPLNSISRCCSGKLQSAGKNPQTGEKLHWMYANSINDSLVV